MPSRPNILFIMSDDHAAHAISAYGSVINRTPHIDRLAETGVRLDNCFCTNSICTPSRATILTGQHGHVNGVREWEALDNRRPFQLQKLLGAAGYQTALFGKWHLGHGLTRSAWVDDESGPGAVPSEPAGFDAWATLPGQGDYYDPRFHTPDGDITVAGYCSDVITDMSLQWLNEQRDPDRPFFLCVHHKAPHRPWNPGDRYRNLYRDEEIPRPSTFDDDYASRPAAAAAKMRILGDLVREDVKADPPDGLDDAALKNWYYQRYIKDYLRCVASVDASVGRLLDWLGLAGLDDDTLVIYTSDQGFFLGDHGWYDKRFIYEHSLRMPMVVRYPRELAPGTACDRMLTNLDFAPTLLDYAGVAIPDAMQGVSGRGMLRGDVPPDWQTSFYYRYWDHGGHNVCAHYGVRTLEHKLVHFYRPERVMSGEAGEPIIDPYWELFDLGADPNELRNVYDNPRYAEVQQALHHELDRLREKYGDR
ncbi:MAG: sulfatase [Phycisphaeraceae bacterium]|nr:sulfatase [Phycisphaeraceae bacterium]